MIFVGGRLMMQCKAIERIISNKSDFDTVKDLIRINDTDYELIKRYDLLETIAGTTIETRMINLIISCWNAKDWLKEDISKLKDISTSCRFQNALFGYDSTHMLQYIADESKHGKLDKDRMSRNKYVNIEPHLTKTVLMLGNNAYPGRYKPFFEQISDDSSVPPFSIREVSAYKDGVLYYNFDTVILTMQIADKDGNVIGDAIKVVDDFVSNLLKEYDKFSK